MKQRSMVKMGFGIFAGLFLAVTILSSFMSRDAGYNIVVQDTLFGTYRVYDETGVNFKVPFFTKVTRYKQVATVGFGNEDQGDFTRNNDSVSVTFADTYNGNVPATFRFRLPRDQDQILAMHKEFRSFDNLVDALLVKNARNVTVVTGTQYTGEEFFQGGLNQFKVRLEDQLRNGLYETERRQVEIEAADVAPVSSENSDPNTLSQRRQLVWKNVLIHDNNGQPKRLANPLAEYGIEVTQVTVGRPIPEDRLANLLVTKKELVAKRIAAEQEIETAKAEAKAAAQRVEIEKQRAVQIEQKEKEVAIIQGQKQVEIEKQQAQRELVQQDKERQVAVIKKQKELEIAQAERDIQAANAEAARFQAIAIKEKGLAEAEVDRAKLLAKQTAKDIYMAEIQRDIAQVLYTNLSKFKVEMPTNVVTGNGNGQLPNNLDVLTTFGALGVMDRMGVNLKTPASVPPTTK